MRTSCKTTALAGKNKGILCLFLPAIDIVTIVTCCAAGGLIDFSQATQTVERGLLLVMLVTGFVVYCQQLGHYSRRRQFWDETGDVVAASLLALAIDTGLFHLLELERSANSMLSSWGLVAAAVPSTRLVAKRISVALGGWTLPTVIIGTGPTATEAARAYESDSHLGYDVVAFIDPNAPPGTMRELTIGKRRLPVQPLVPPVDVLPIWLVRPHVLIALELDEFSALDHLIEKLAANSVALDIIPPVRGLPGHYGQTSYFFTYDFLVIRTRSGLTRPSAQIAKRGLDVIMAGAVLAFLAPLLALVALLLWREGQPILVAETMVGRYGKLFECLTFRSMAPDKSTGLEALLDRVAGAEWPRKCRPGCDPRSFSVGHYLHMSSLDAVPQLWNVIKGEMSLVGPRPITPSKLNRYGDSKCYYLELRPGITGLTHLRYRFPSELERRIRLNSWYIRNWSLWDDIFILCRSIASVPGNDGTH